MILYTQPNKIFEEEIKSFKQFNLEKKAARVVDKAVKYFQKNKFELQVEMDVPHRLHDVVEQLVLNKPIVVSRLMFNMNRLRFTSVIKVNSNVGKSI